MLPCYLHGSPRGIDRERDVYRLGLESGLLHVDATRVDTCADAMAPVLTSHDATLDDAQRATLLSEMQALVVEPNAVQYADWGTAVVTITHADGTHDAGEVNGAKGLCGIRQAELKTLDDALRSFALSDAR